MEGKCRTKIIEPMMNLYERTRNPVSGYKPGQKTVNLLPGIGSQLMRTAKPFRRANVPLDRLDILEFCPTTH